MKNKIDKLRFAGWYAPNPTDDMFKRYAESGLDYLFLLRDDGYVSSNVPLTEKYLALCDKYNIKTYLRRDKNLSIKETYDISHPYSNYSSFKGYCIYDEPNLDEMDKFKGELDEYKVLFKNYDFFINLFPSYADEKNVGKEWKNYIKEYAKKILVNIDSGERWLSFDFYAICFSYDWGNYLAENWLKNTETVADFADEYNAYFNAFVQAMPFSGTETTRGSRDRVPSYKDISLQVYTNLAFGAKMISYFCYDTPPLNREFLKRHFAMIDRDYNKTSIYEAVKKVNGEVNNFQSEYIKYDRIGTYGISKENYYMFERMKKKKLTEKVTDIMNLDFSGNLLLGVFEKKNNIALIPVNFGETTCNNAHELTIMFKETKKIRISKKGETKELTVKGNFVVYLDIGEGCFIEVFNI